MTVLNAGIMNVGKMELVEGPKLQAMLDANSYSPAVMVKMFLPILEARCNNKRRSGLITTSSMSAKVVASGNVMYHSSKVMVNYLMEAVCYELKKANSKVDVMNLIPGGVFTNMVRQADGDPASRAGPTLRCLGGIVPVSQCVNGALRDISRETESTGTLIHDFQLWWAKWLYKFNLIPPYDGLFKKEKPEPTRVI